jgi:predicted O-methyltransferase YrrM
MTDKSSIDNMLSRLKDDPLVTTSSEELHGLYKSASENMMTNGLIIEIGAYNGRSTCVLGLVAMQNGGRVISIDISEREFFHSNINQAGIAQYIDVVRSSSRLALQQIKSQNKQCSVLFLDGDHTYETVLWELQNYSKLVSPDGVIVGHDYYNSATSQVERAVSDFLKDNDDWYIDGRFGGKTTNASITDIMYRLKRRQGSRL